MRHFISAALLAGVLGVAFAAAQEKREDPVAVGLRVEPTQAHLGQKLALHLTMTNRSAREVKLLFRSGRKYDFIVKRGEEEVWRWSRGRVFTMAITQITLKPGESRTFEATWEQETKDGDHVPEGTYAVTGLVTTRPEIRSAPVEIRITPAKQAGG